MRNKNGFIATSVLYAFLIAFLTLFLAFMANYIQNKQLVNRIEEMAREDLEKYGNTKISDLKLGDYVVFDTLDNVGDGVTNLVKYSAPISPNAKWIFYHKEEKVDDTYDAYYFVSAADAQKAEVIGTAIYSFDYGTGSERKDNIPLGMHYGNLATTSKLINGNVYYEPNSRTYSSYPKSDVNSISYNGAYKVYSYQFMYFVNGGIDVRFMNNSDFQVIESIENDKIKDAIYDQKVKYTIWNDSTDPYGDLNKTGFYQIDYKAISEADNTNETLINDKCKKNIGYGHTYLKNGEEMYDSCYFTNESYYIGTCTNDTNMNSNCKTGTQNPRYIAIIKVNDSATDGYIDSGNGTNQLPYLITKGVKK